MAEIRPRDLLSDGLLERLGGTANYTGFRLPYQVLIVMCS